jgi:hypothetical protein
MRGQRVAAIHLEDGTSVPVARIHGSPSYQKFTRHPVSPASIENNAYCQLLARPLEHLTSITGLEVNFCNHADTTGTKSLLSALRSAAETYLGSNICFASLSLDAVDERQVAVAEHALRSLGIRQVLPTCHSGMQFMLAHIPKDVPDFDEEPLLVLAADYSLHWFNVGLYIIGEEGVVETIEETIKGPRINEANQLGALREALRQLFASPPQTMTLPAQIDRLIVYGDDAENHALRQLLAELLNDKVMRDAHVASSVFDGVDYMAHTVHERIIWMELDGIEPAFGCQWRSKLYRTDHSEL